MQGFYRKRSAGALIYLKIVLEIIRVSNYDNIVLKQTIDRKEVTINWVIDPCCTCRVAVVAAAITTRVRAVAVLAYMFISRNTNVNAGQDSRG